MVAADIILQLRGPFNMDLIPDTAQEASRLSGLVQTAALPSLEQLPDSQPLQQTHDHFGPSSSIV